ncbi:SDR family NAD(P)-dependent oxidoreductase [Sphingomonas naphthae]|uniref:SDR family NAD(P)-dependent oxidoreductase n=1 Tax=Sphingomonas naphthae TaxID=1813468 RepID=A0ABY7TM91_9SPHN|nr:SDR family NAD(P)-dependent oxidoreductase [Sphingomonas naphthae]WCT74343.1 SDR family NAD(P)-dependent oxidoreductase [Sphingomonas naphthae]
MGDFTGQTIVVTGGSGGLGRAIATAFAGQGGRVVVADLDLPAAEAVAASLEGAVAHPLDVTDEASWDALLDRVDADLGGLDVLVNNAGIFVPNIPFEDMSLDLWRRHIAVNLDGTFLGCRQAIRRMKGRGKGAIVNMGSGMSIRANPLASAYCASKAGVLMTTRTAAHAAGKYGIRVNCVLPGPVHTAMLMGNVAPGGDEDAFLTRMLGNSPMGVMASPEDIAAGVVFLASPAAKAITGVHLPVDGGNMPGG